MPPTLDEIPLNPNTQKRFTKLSLACSFINIGFGAYLLIRIVKTINATAPPIKPSMLFTFLFHGFIFTGVIMTILSFTKKEPTTWAKWIGGVLNILLFLLIEGTVAFAYYMDLSR